MYSRTKKVLTLGLLTVLTVTAGCGSSNSEYENMKLRAPNSVVVCRQKQCAPAKVAMSSEYIYNSLTHMLTNNNRQKALICEANPGSHACTENFITLPVKIGITPAYMYIDSVKITDVTIVKGAPQINLVLNYNVTANGQSYECGSSNSLLYVKNADNIIMEDNSYFCKMTSVGTTYVKTLFMVDYIDLDYGYIGGYYSIGLTGPAKGGSAGYMLIRLPNDNLKLTPKLMNPKTKAKKTATTGSILDNESSADTADGVQIFPISK